MELDCTTWENVTFEKVVNDLIYVKRNNKDAPFFDKIIVLNKYGCCTDHKDEKCRIFPKDKNTWEGFHRPFKDGDIVATNANQQIFILQRLNRSTLSNCYQGDCYTGYDFEYNEFFQAGEWAFERHATEEEKQKFFDTIKANGYRWNPETKKLEELPKFKVGDKIIDVLKKHMGASGSQGIISEITNEKYIFNDGSYLPIKCQDGWELVPNKFDINTLKPFDKVLVRNTKNGKWCGQFYMNYDKNEEYPFECIYNYWRYCIPYKGNEHLSGKTDDCAEFYKL
jgi:hypothetical protein